jgi:hypothetical protein
VLRRPVTLDRWDTADWDTADWGAAGGGTAAVGTAAVGTAGVGMADSTAIGLRFCGSVGPAEPST